MNSGPTLQLGSTGDDVKRVQRIFVVEKTYPYNEIDGVFGPLTQNAVEQFQRQSGLTVDGIIGPQTWAALMPDIDPPELAEGAFGPSVMVVQRALANHDLYTGPVDSTFGPLTAAAVREYQQQRGITVDGIIGDETWFAPIDAAGKTLFSIT